MEGKFWAVWREEYSAFTRSKNRRRKRHKEKIYDVSYNIANRSNRGG